MLTSLIATVCLGIQFQSQPIKIPRTDYKVAAFPGAFLLSWGLVQDELQLSAAVVRGLHQSRIAHDSQIQAIMARPSPQARYRNTLSPAMANALNQVSTGQKRRLGEIYLQYYDVNALADPYVAKMVGLSVTQAEYAKKRLTAAHHKHLDAQEAMFETFRKDNEELVKKIKPPSTGPSGRISYTVPRDVQYRHTDLTRRVSLVRIREMTQARADIRRTLTLRQLAKLEELKGRRIPQWFFEGGNWGTAQPHPDLVLNINVQAEMGFTVKQYLDIQKRVHEARTRKDAPTVVKKVIAGMTPAQKAILRSYELQYDREYSIMRHDVSHQLGVGPGTRDRIALRLEEIEVEARSLADREWIVDNSQDSSKRRDPILKKCDEDKRRAILYFLTADQRKKWKAMLGKPLPEIQPGRHFG